MTPSPVWRESSEPVPMIVYWRGVPLSEMSRGELEREFAAAHATIQRLQREVCDRSVAHVRDLAALLRPTPNTGTDR
jgi:hypothetical protein